MKLFNLLGKLLHGNNEELTILNRTHRKQQKELKDAINYKVVVDEVVVDVVEVVQVTSL